MIVPDMPEVSMTNTNKQVVQDSHAKPDESALSGHAKNETVKKWILRYLVGQSIRENDQAGVQLTGVTIYDFQTDSAIMNHNENGVHFAASVNKLPVTLLVLKDLRSGALNMNQVITWQASDVRAGLGTFDQPGAPLQATLQELLQDMLNRSGNTAVRAIVNGILGGPHAVNARFEQIPEIPNTRLQPLDATRFYVGNTTPKESLWVLKELLKDSDSHSAFIKEALATNIYTELGVKSQLAGNDYIVLANKIGWLYDPDGNNNHDVGVIYNTKTGKSYGYSFMTTAAYEDKAATDRAAQSLKDMGRYLLRFTGDKKHHEHRALGPDVQSLHKRSQQQPEAKIEY